MLTVPYITINIIIICYEDTSGSLDWLVHRIGVWNCKQWWISFPLNKLKRFISEYTLHSEVQGPNSTSIWLLLAGMVYYGVVLLEKSIPPPWSKH